MKNNKFIILVHTFNHKDYIRRCLDSILSQDYKNYEVVVIDGQSRDETWDIINTYPFHVNIIEDTDVIFMGMIRAIKLYAKHREDIIVLLDGDDYFAGDFVLSVLNSVYQNNIWLTYGQYLPESKDYQDMCQPITNTRIYRQSGRWVTSHLKTFKRWLWDKIKHKDLQDDEGHYLKTSGDRAFMYPMIEMAGVKRIKFISKVLYIYNDINPNSKTRSKGGAEESIRVAEYVMRKPVYKEL